MSDTYILAFIIMPIVVSALGWGDVFLHEWAERREDRRAAERR